MILDVITSKALPILGGALAVSLLGNVILGLVAHHSAASTTHCKDSVVATATAAVKTKKIVELRQEKTVAKDDTDIRSTLAGTIQRLHDSQSGRRYLPSPTGPTGDPTGEGPAPELLSSTVEDQKVCVINTVLLEGWQTFYQHLQDIRKEEDEANSKLSRGPRSTGRHLPDVLFGQRQGSDNRNGADGSVRSRSPEVRTGQPPDFSDVPDSGGVSPAESIPTGY